MEMLAISQFFASLTTASVLFLMAAGLTLIFGVVGVVNLAHASFFLFAAYTACSITTLTSNYWVALIVSPILVALIGGIVEMVFFRRVYALAHGYQLLLGFGLSFIFADLMKLIWGGAGGYCNLRPPVLTGTVYVGEVPVPIYNLFLISMAILMAVLLWAFLYKTRMGNLIRAIEQDREASAAVGINVATISTLVFMGACWMAGVAGAITSSLQLIMHGLDAEMLIPAFLVVVIGGMGSVAGSAIAAVLMGLVSSYGILVVPQFAPAFMYIIFALVVIVRPWGLLGERLQ